jgi:hypothetical protein
MIFHPKSIWNVPIGANPVVLTQYSAFLSRADRPAINGVTNFGIPVYDAGPDTPRATVYNVRNIPQVVPVPPGVIANPASDGNLVIRDKRAGIAYSFYRWKDNGDGTYSSIGACWGNISSSGNGVDNFWDDYQGWTGSRASGWNYIAGLIMLDELRAGRIDHALAISINVDLVHKSEIVWPAKATDGRSLDPASLRMGLRLQLDPALDLDSLRWNGKPLTPAARVIARTLQKYGAYLGDTGSTTSLYCQSFLSWDPSITSDPPRMIDWNVWGFPNGAVVMDRKPWLDLGIDWNSVAAIPPSSFRVVEVQPADFFTAAEAPASYVPEHALSIFVQGQGTTTPAPGAHAVKEGESINVTATPSSGWRFSHWLDGDGNLVSANRTVTVNVVGDASLQAVFEKVRTVTLVIKVQGEGVTSPGPGVYEIEIE